MIKKTLVIIISALILGLAQAHVSPAILSETVQEKVLARREMSLANRYPVSSVNSVFRDNILLNIHYMAGAVRQPSDIRWEKVRSDFQYELEIPAGKVFAYHADVLPEFEGRVVSTTNATFGPEDGFVSSGYLYGDGVCHLASLMNWAARDAGLRVVSPVNHDFARIPDISREYGTAIYYMPGSVTANAQQNLYIENTTDKPVRMIVSYADDIVSVRFVSK